jgi:pimeloyl-ACP methyl ester carboxylesterase
VRQRLNELRFGREPLRLAANALRLRSAPDGDNRSAVLFPGFQADDASMIPLRLFLRQHGHDAQGWGLGRNRGEVDGVLDDTIAVVERSADTSGRPVNVIGWSLGGVFAREIARERPDLVHRVVTFGTPLLGPRYSVAAATYGEAALIRIEALIAETTARPIQRPITAVYSRRDGVVDWRTCIDHSSPDVENIELTSSHIGLGIDPDLWSLIANRLAHSQP